MSAPEQHRETRLQPARTSTEDAAFSSDASELRIAIANSQASIENAAEQKQEPSFDGYIKHYEIIRKLGEGGMGAVLLARDTKIGRLVAIKLLHASGRAASRMLAEAQATARCRHENIVVIHDVDEVAGQPYMVLEYFEGRTLREVLAAHTDGDKRGLPERLALDIVTAVVKALATVHKEGVVHRDLKPENIMMLDGGQIKLLDFGIAWRADNPLQRARSGTLSYMAPEQWLASDIDARTDLWAVGLLLYEFLAGVHPLGKATREQLEIVADLNTPMPRLLDARPNLGSLSDIVERCLHKRKEHRFSSADELLAALDLARVDENGAALAKETLPFAGLLAFQEADAKRFYGREGDIAALVGKLRNNRLVTVAGPSGAGKSSFVRAGVVPALKRSGELWDVLVLRPGRNPVTALADALESEVFQNEPWANVDFRAEPGQVGARLRAHCRAASGRRRLLVFVDQFEELYTLVSNPAERSAFLQCLLGAADEVSSPLRVILSIRSDFLDRIAEDRSFMSEVSQCLFFLPPIGREGLREALVKPVEAAGHQFESENMVDEILDELARTKTPLPLLQFAAAALWEARDSTQKRLTKSSYEAIGGVVGSLSTHADSVFMALSPADQQLCQAIFLRLVTPERTRAIVDISELSSLAEDPHAAESLIQHSCGARLLWIENADGEAGSVTVEIVHESLIERWSRLARWLDESTADARFLARLRAAASQWQAGGEIDGLLWRDRAAEEARDWYERRRANPNAERGLPLAQKKEERYLRSVINHLDRARRRRQWSIAGAFALLGSVSALVFFLAMRSQTHAERADAEASRVKEQNADLAFQALRGRNAIRLLAARKRHDDPTLVLALLREVEPGDIPKDWSELVSAAFSQGIATATARPHGASIVYSATVSPNGKTIITTSSDKTARILRFDDLHEMVVLRGHEGDVWSAAWSPDGAFIATTSFDNTVRICRADGEGKPLVLPHDAPVGAADWSPDGLFVVTASDDKMARVFRASDATLVASMRHDAEVNSAKFSPDGKRIVTAAHDGITRVWNANGEGVPLLLRGHQGSISAAAFRPDGKRIATAGLDRTVRIWDAAKGDEILVLRGHEDRVMGIAWSPDGKFIATASKDKTARVFRADGWGDPIILKGHAHWVYSVHFSPDGHHLVTASLDLSIRRWNLDTIATSTAIAGFPLAFSPKSDRIALGKTDGTIRIWNVADPNDGFVLHGHTDPIVYLDFSPDGTHLLSAADKTARLWKTNEVAEPLLIVHHPDFVTKAQFNKHGDRILSTSGDGKLIVSHVDGTGKPFDLQAPVPEGAFLYANFDASGQRVITGSTKHNSLRVWKLDAPEKTIDLVGHEKPITWASLSPDGTRIATASNDQTARIWNLDGQGPSVVLRGHTAPLLSIAWSPDSEKVVTTSHDHTARIFRADGIEEPVVLLGHEDRINHAAFSPDGKRIITSANDRTARVFRVDGTGEPLVLGGANVRLTDAYWSPDGKMLVTQSDDGLQHLWPDAIPFSGPHDARLWRAMTHCMPIEIRMSLLRNTEDVARTDDEACRRRVEAAKSAQIVPPFSSQDPRANGANDANGQP